MCATNNLRLHLLFCRILLRNRSMEYKKVLFWQGRPRRDSLRHRAMLNYYTQKIKALADDGDEEEDDDDDTAVPIRRPGSGRQGDNHRVISGSTPNLKDDSARRVSFFTSTPRARSVSESNDGGGSVTGAYSSDGESSPPILSNNKAPPLLVVQPPASEVRGSRSGSFAATADDAGRTPAGFQCKCLSIGFFFSLLVDQELRFH